MADRPHEHVTGPVRRSGAVLAVVLGSAMATLITLLAPVPPALAAELSWSGPIARDVGVSGPALIAVACPAANTCSALTVAGGALAFDPSAPAAATPTGVDSSTPLAVTCPSAGLCVAVDAAGNAVAYNPASPAGAKVQTVDGGNVPDAVTCFSASSCVSVDTTGDEVTFDPAGATAPALRTIDAGQFITAVSCPSATECVAVEASDRYVAFNPVSGAVITQSTLNDFSGTSTPLNAVACVSATVCEAFNGNGSEIQFNPKGSGVTIVPLDKGNSIIAVACPSAGQCTTLDAAGNEITFQPGTSTAPGGGKANTVVVDTAGDATDLACAGVARCVVVTGHGKAVGFDPLAATVGSSVAIDAGVGSYTAVACASAAQCTGADQQGDALTFDPQSGAALAVGAVDPGATTVYALACPAPTQCTLVDAGGNEVTFNPQSPGPPSGKQLVASHPLLAIACPSVGQCTAVTDDRDEITFNPQSPASATFVSLGTPAGTALTGVACPSATLCTAVDGTGEAVTFDPLAPGKPTPYSVLPAAAVSVACPATSECVAVDALGNRATFDPGAPAARTTSSIDGSQPEALQCVTATYCVTLDAGGRAVEFDPHGAGATSSAPIAAGATVTGLACLPSDECVAVERSGQAYVGTGHLPSLPAAVAAPSIKGRAHQGATLTADPGAWSNGPTSFAARWERCAASGGSCRPIAGATAQTYRPVQADVGSRLRVSEDAANQSGYGPAAISAATTQVTGAPAPPVIGRPVLALTRSGRARLRFTLTAARYGPELRGFLVTLPAGVAFKASRSGRGHRHAPAVPGLTARVRGQRMPLTASAARGQVTLMLRRNAHTLLLTFISPQLSVSHSLGRRLRGRHPVTLSLTVSLTGPTARGLHTVRQWTIHSQSKTKKKVIRALR